MGALLVNGFTRHIYNYVFAMDNHELYKVLYLA